MKISQYLVSTHKNILNYVYVGHLDVHVFRCFGNSTPVNDSTQCLYDLTTKLNISDVDQNTSYTSHELSINPSFLMLCDIDVVTMNLQHPFHPSQNHNDISM